ncbi:MAG TPA: cell division protein FtsZ [Candidatus Kapabacteria bacterium]|nr:cell division protein FtsZ [Candidatus Kapabacteria bacterium]
MIELDRSVEHHGAKIKIVGVGGGGGNAVNSMIERGLEGCEFIAVNTDMQALTNNLSSVKCHVGKQLTRGLGAGANPEVGSNAVEEDREEITQVLSGADMVFVTAGMGGGTGTGGAPVVAEIARSQGALVVGIVTRPFDWEGQRRKAQAELGIAELKKHVDTLIVVPNQKLLSIIDKRTGFKEAFHKVDDVLYNATRGIAQIITGHGIVNVDFADVRTVMADMGDALMGTGMAAGEYRATEAAQNAISSPLLEGISITGSQGVLINITASSELTMMEVDESVKIVHEAVGAEANIIFGVVLDDDLGDNMMVTVIATGFNRARENRPATQQQVALHAQAQQQPATQQPAVPAQQPARQVRMDSTPDQANVPIGQRDLERYNEPAYMRRGTGINRGGYDIRKREEAAPKAEEKPAEQSKQAEAQEQPKRQAAADKPAFLRRIMD